MGSSWLNAGRNFDNSLSFKKSLIPRFLIVGQCYFLFYADQDIVLFFLSKLSSVVLIKVENQNLGFKLDVSNFSNGVKFTPICQVRSLKKE